ncbi:tyrosine-type recombinase/integrase [Streptomyces mauvecolor]
MTDDALRTGLAEVVARHLTYQVGQLTLHVLRHFVAADLYRNGMDVVATQEILGHEWLNTTMIYLHVEKSHVEDAWVRAGQQMEARFGGSR